jgi:hypothetical protein
MPFPLQPTVFVTYSGKLMEYGSIKARDINNSEELIAIAQTVASKTDPFLLEILLKC